MAGEGVGVANLGRSGLKISKVILGGMSYGSPKWQGWVLDEAASLPLLKHAYDAGIRTWDTADVYSGGRSEAVMGKALKEYNIPRSKVVLLSKCYFGVDESLTSTSGLMSPNAGENLNQIGLSRKHIFDAVEKSVARLGTYIDVLQIHRLDRETPKEEIMKALNDVVEKGWVRYIGASSMWAWEFQELQNIADRKGWHKFVSMQNYHNLIYREEEREMIPYCKSAGIGLIPWSPIARGKLARPWNEQSSREETDVFISFLLQQKEAHVDKQINERVEEIAKKKGVSMTQVCIAWSIAKGCCPIVGMNKKERIDEAVAATNLELSEEEIKYLEELYEPKAIRGH